MGQSTGTVLILVGLALAGAGLLAWAGLLDWFGRLPGDIRYQSGNVHVFIPITSMILVSVALSVLVYLVRRLL